MGTARLPSAVLVRSEGNQWQIVDRVEWGEFERGYFSLDDVNDDGIPEVVGSFPGEGAFVVNTRGHMDYVVYKLVRHRYKKVWYAGLEAAPAMLIRFRHALNKGDEVEACRVTTSPSVVKDAKKLGLWGHASEWNDDGWWTDQDFEWSFQEIHDGAPQPYAIAEIRGETYRIDLARLSQWRWRIRGIARCEK